MKQSLRTLLRHSGRPLGGFVIGLLLLPLHLAANPAIAAVTVRIQTSDAIPGGTLPLVMSLQREVGDRSVASAQVDLIYQAEQLALPGSCSGDGSACTTHTDCGSGSCELLCEKDGRLSQQDFNATFPEFQNVEPGQRRVRLRLLAPIQVTLPLPTIADGILALCMFQIPTTAPLGPISLAGTRLEVGDEESNTVAASIVIEAGSIVAQLPTETPTATVEPSATPTETEAAPTPTSTATPVPPTATQPPSHTATVAPATPTPMATAVPATATASVVPSTPTIPPSTPPSVPPTTGPTNTATAVKTPTAANTATPGTSKRSDDDGCAIITTAETRTSPGLIWLGLPLALLVGLRRSRRQAC